MTQEGGGKNGGLHWLWEEEEEICRIEREEERWLFHVCEWWSCRHWSGVRQMKLLVEEMMVQVGCDMRKKKLVKEKRERSLRWCYY